MEFILCEILDYPTKARAIGQDFVFCLGFCKRWILAILISQE